MNIEEYKNLIKKSKKTYRQVEGQHQSNLGMLLNGVLMPFLSPKLLFWSYSASGEKKPLKTAILQKRKGLNKGKPDYEFYIKDGDVIRIVFLETKAGKGSLTPHQKKFFNDFCDYNNVRCYISKDIEQSIDILKNEKILLFSS